MILAGASRHAKEIIQILNQNRIEIDYLFDDVSSDFDLYFEKYKKIRDLKELELCNINSFALGLGGTTARRKVFEKLTTANKIPINIVSETSVIGNVGVKLGIGLNIMHFVFISDNTVIGNGCLLNAFSSVHHDVILGEFVEVSPRSTLLGGVQIGSNTMIGAGSIVLPDIKIGNNCIIGAGSLVTKNIPDNSKAYGVPSRIIV